MIADADRTAGLLADVVQWVADTADRESLAVVGIHRRGVPLARRLVEALPDGPPVPVGALDIALYRDDVGGRSPVVHGTDLDFDVEGRDIVLLDDVLWTGRTVRAALDQIMDFGRPARVRLAVLCVRDGRELPIQADFHPPDLPVQEGPVRVRVREIDGADVIVIPEEDA